MLKENQMSWTLVSSADLNQASQTTALARQAQLTKPAGSLGQLEAVAVQLSAMQGTAVPQIKQPYIAIFAGDHGIANEGVSAFPQVVTLEMIRNFSRRGAAISVLAQSQGAILAVYNCGTVNPVEPLADVFDWRVADGTANFLIQPAMTVSQLEQALAIGRAAVTTAQAQGCDLFIAGEMGIANTTSATACACAVLGLSPSELTGRGTGISDTQLTHKMKVIEQGLARHQQAFDTPLAVLQHVGGFEIAAMVGAYIASAQAGLPILVDGFISSVSALIAVRHNPSVLDWMIFSHASAEKGHAAILQALNVTPLLTLGLRLGEGSGAGVAISLLRLACDLHNNMATFDAAQVSQA
jgi:nicotinate-nucleotide--dimethylbenzimidazole phosphoribosyltransferase